MYKSSRESFNVKKVREWNSGKFQAVLEHVHCRKTNNKSELYFSLQSNRKKHQFVSDDLYETFLNLLVANDEYSRHARKVITISYLN